MQEVSVDLANAESGEACFLLQIRVPETPGDAGGALVDKISRFVGLYLSAAQPDEARHAQMGALNWMIAAPEEAWRALDAVRADLATTLFGDDDGERVQLEAPGLDIPERADAGASDEAEAAADPGMTAPDDAAAINDEADLWIEADAAPAPEEAEAAGFAGQEVFVIDAEEAPSPVESFDIETDAFEPAARAPDLPAEDDSDWEIAGATAARRAAFDDDSDVFEVDGLDIEIVDGETSEVTDMLDVDALAIDPSAAPETLTETPPRPADRDIASELAAFRAEMREIASGIPVGHGAETLTAFRAELDAIAGSMGQRVDGAAQRIESAADRIAVAGEQLDGARLNDAAARAEASAERMEKGVEDALGALNAAVRAMAGAPLGDAAGAGG